MNCTFNEIESQMRLLRPFAIALVFLRQGDKFVWSVPKKLANYHNTSHETNRNLTLNSPHKLVISTRETLAFENWRSKSHNIGFCLFPNQLSLFKIYSNQSRHPARGIVLDPSFCELAKQILCCGVAEQKLQQRLGRDSPDLRYLKCGMGSRFSGAGLAQKNQTSQKEKMP